MVSYKLMILIVCKDTDALPVLLTGRSMYVQFVSFFLTM